MYDERTGCSLQQTKGKNSARIRHVFYWCLVKQYVPPGIIVPKVFNCIHGNQYETRRDGQGAKGIRSCSVAHHVCFTLEGKDHGSFQLSVPSTYLVRDSGIRMLGESQACDNETNQNGHLVGLFGQALSSPARPDQALSAHQCLSKVKLNGQVIWSGLVWWWVSCRVCMWCTWAVSSCL